MQNHSNQQADAKITFISDEVLVMTTPEETYRALVQRYMVAGKLSDEGQEALEIDRAHLGLLPATARAIEQAVAEQESVPIAAPSSPSSSQTSAPPVLIPVLPIVDPNGSNLVMLRPDLNGPEEQAETSQPVRSADYLAHREQYKQELWQALKDNGQLTNEAYAHLSKLAEQFDFSARDVAEILQEVTQAITTGKPQPPDQTAISAEESAASGGSEAATKIEQSEAAEVTEVAEPKPTYDSEFNEPFEQLEKNLAGGKLRAADQITCDILLTLIPEPGWFNEAALRTFRPTSPDKAVIQTLDQLWLKYTETGGFSRQLQVFGEVPQENLDRRQNDNRLQTLMFSRNVEWWTDILEFYKLYSQLNFTAQAPLGHLPARWFWQIPRSRALEYGNFGILAERGGCRIEGYILPAFMAMLSRCDIEAI